MKSSQQKLRHKHDKEDRQSSIHPNFTGAAQEKFVMQDVCLWLRCKLNLYT